MKTLKFKIGQEVRFIGGAEENYHPEYQEIRGVVGKVVEACDVAFITWPYEIKVNGNCYPVRESEIEAV